MYYGDMVFKSEFDHLDDALTLGIGGYDVLKKTCCKNIFWVLAQKKSHEAPSKLHIQIE